MPKMICDYITAYVIIKHKRSTSSETDVTPLKQCLLDVGQLVVRCSRRGWIGKILHSSQDRKDMENVDRRLGNMRDHLGLASKTTVGVMIHDLKAQVVTAAEVGGHLFNVCTYFVFIRVECHIGQYGAPRISWVGCTSWGTILDLPSSPTGG